MTIAVNVAATRTYFAKRTTADKLHCLKFTLSAVENFFDFNAPFQVFLNLFLELQ